MPMKPSELFALAIRLAGLWLLLVILPGLVGDVSRLLHYLFELKLLALVEFALGVCWKYVVAWWLLTGAPALQKLAYPSSSN